MSIQWLLTGAIALSCASAFASDTSAEAAVFVDAKSTSFWRTGASSSFDLPLEYPPLASSVDVTIRGVRYSSSTPGVTAASLPVALPAPTTDSAENVYEITLAFNDGTTNKCAFALVRSQSFGSSCPVRIVSEGRWNRTTAKQVVAVPAGYEPSIDSAVVFACLDGGRGWFACPKLSTGEHVFTLSGPDGETSRTMEYVASGFFINIR